jgi:hypothetical protein
MGRFAPFARLEGSGDVVIDFENCLTVLKVKRLCTLLTLFTPNNNDLDRSK